MRSQTRASILLLLPLVGCVHGLGPAPKPFVLQPGDLLFQDLDYGPLCDAIETVTQGVGGAHLTHVGMVESVDGPEAIVFEAVGAGVVETPLSEFLARSADPTGKPKVLVGRLDMEHQSLIPAALATARKFLGRPYDSVYAMDNTSFYCSELVYESLREANGGVPIFSLAPMTFKDPRTAKTFPPWQAYYDALGVVIPEGEAGLNPGGISRSPYVRIVHAYGKPTGWRGIVTENSTTFDSE